MTFRVRSTRLDDRTPPTSSSTTALTERIEFNFDIPLLTIYNSRISSLGSPTGNGDADFGVKYNFYQESAGSWLPASTATLYVEFPTGSVEKTTGSGLGG